MFTELHLNVQRNVLFRITQLDFSHQSMILSQTFWDLVEFFWILFSKMPSTSLQEILKESFFSEKAHICLSKSQILSKNVRVFGKVFSTELSELYSRCQIEHLEWKFFTKKNIFILFSGLWSEKLRILSVSFHQLQQNCIIYVYIGMFSGKIMIADRDVIFRGV